MSSILLCSQQHTIDRDGVVTDTKTRRTVPCCAVPAVGGGVVHLGVRLGEGESQRTFLIWRLLSVQFFANSLLIPRDGNFMNFREGNFFPLRKVSSLKISRPEEIHRIWFLYSVQKVPCWDLALKANLPYYSVDEFKTLIGDILFGGIR